MRLPPAVFSLHERNEYETVPPHSPRATCQATQIAPRMGADASEPDGVVSGARSKQRIRGHEGIRTPDISVRSRTLCPN